MQHAVHSHKSALHSGVGLHCPDRPCLSSVITYLNCRQYCLVSFPTTAESPSSLIPLSSFVFMPFLSSLSYFLLSILPLYHLRHVSQNLAPLRRNRSDPCVRVNALGASLSNQRHCAPVNCERPLLPTAGFSGHDCKRLEVKADISVRVVATTALQTMPNCRFSSGKAASL